MTIKDGKIFQDWNCFSQFVVPNVKSEHKFILRASVKVKSVNGSAGLWSRVNDLDGNITFFDNMENRPILDKDWKIYSIEGVIDEKTEKLYFGGLCNYNGEFCFSNFELFLENGLGELKNIYLDNPNFENTTNQLSIPGWRQGAGKNKPIFVEEYSFSSSMDKQLNTYYLKVKGKGIFDFDKYIKEVSNENVLALMRTLHNLNTRMKNVVNGLNIQELDFSINENINTIGISLIHIAAVESYYQVITFENRKFNYEENLNWNIAIKLGREATENYKGHSLDYYLKICSKVRKKTYKKMKDIDENWLQFVSTESSMNNYLNWLHVIEHQSYHLGQIVMLKKLMKSEK